MINNPTGLAKAPVGLFAYVEAIAAMFYLLKIFVTR